MKFNDYQNHVAALSVYREKVSNYVDSLGIPDEEKATNLKVLLCRAYAVLGLVGEAGELANKLKKVIRDTGGVCSEEAEQAMSDENGDVTFYNAAVFAELDRTFSLGAQDNLAKLFGRRDRGTLAGSGDQR